MTQVAPQGFRCNEVKETSNYNCVMQICPLSGLQLPTCLGKNSQVQTYQVRDSDKQSLWSEASASESVRCKSLGRGLVWGSSLEC